MNKEGKTLNWLKEQSKTCFNDGKILKFIPPKEKVLIDKEEYDRLHNLQSKIDKAIEILNTLCIVQPYESVNGEFHKYYRPVKNTTKQEVYKAIYDLRDILKEDK